MKKICLCFLICIYVLMVTISSGYCVKAYFVDDVFASFTSDSYILIDLESDTVLASKNINDKMQVASICKLMTCLITIEKIEEGIINLNDMVVASENACLMEGSQAFLDAGCEYKVSDILKSVIVASANDSAVVLAELISGNENSFVALMNKRAKELGMNNTVYANATGLPQPNQYSTALDTSKILKEIYKHDLYVKNSNIWMDSLVHSSGRETDLVNTNRLIKYYDKCKTGKTGFTDEAGYCLASLSSNNNLNLIAVTLKCDKPQDRFKESIELFNYGFANYESKIIVDSSKLLNETIDVCGGKMEKCSLQFKNNFSSVVKKGDRTGYDVKINIEKQISAPKLKNHKVGLATIVKNGKIVGEVDILLSEDIEKQEFNDVINKISKKWSII